MYPIVWITYTSKLEYIFQNIYPNLKLLIGLLHCFCYPWQLLARLYSALPLWQSFLWHNVLCNIVICSISTTQLFNPTFKFECLSHWLIYRSKCWNLRIKAQNVSSWHFCNTTLKQKCLYDQKYSLKLSILFKLKG